jgi:acyl carrier protein
MEILMDDGLRDRLIGLVSQLLGAQARLPEPFPLDLQLSDLGLGSLKMVNLMLAIEREFDIAIPQADITPENFHSLGSMAALVGRLIPPLSEH